MDTCSSLHHPTTFGPSLPALVRSRLLSLRKAEPWEALLLAYQLAGAMGVQDLHALRLHPLQRELVGLTLMLDL